MHRFLIILFFSWWPAAVIWVAEGAAAEEVSPRAEVRENVRQLLETNSCPGCDLSGAVMNRMNLAGADLKAANLAGARLFLVNLSDADLRDANLQGAALGGADLAGADLTGANLTGAVLEGAYLTGAKMEGRIETLRPYADEGGPEASELRFMDDEGSSKDLPFTGGAIIAETEGAASEEASAGGQQSAPAVEPVPGTVPDDRTAAPPAAEPQTGAELSPPSPARPMGESKKLVMIGDPVVPPEPEITEKVDAVPSDFEAATMAASESGIDAAESVPPGPGSGEPVESVPAGAEISKAAEAPAPESDVAVTAAAAEPEVEAEEKAEVEAVSPESVAPDIAEPAAVASGPEAGEKGGIVPPDPQAGEGMEMVASVPRPERAVSADAGDSPMEPEETPDPALARKEELIEKLLDTKRCVDCDLSGVDLSGRRLASADLERSILENADLHETNLREANLKGAVLRGADLRDADLRKADLYKADLSGADLTGARFDGALVDMVTVDGAIGADFEGASGRK